MWMRILDVFFTLLAMLLVFGIGMGIGGALIMENCKCPLVEEEAD